MSYQPPQTRVFTEYAASAAVTASELAACMIGPYYDVHDNVELGAYNSVDALYPYIGLDGSDTIDTADMASVFSCVLKNAQVQGYRSIVYSATPGETGYVGPDGKTFIAGNIVANGGAIGVPAGFPALAIGDTVLHYADGGSLVSTNKIAGFMPCNATAYGIGLPIFDTAATHSVGDVTIGGTHTYAGNALLVFTITAGGKVGTDSVKASLSINGGAAIQSNITCGTSAVSLSGASGITNLTIAFASASEWTTGDKITIAISCPTNATYQSEMGYGAIVFENAETTLTADDYFVLYRSAGDVVNPAGAAFTLTGLQVTAPLTSGGLSLYSGTIAATYRVRKKDYTERVYTVGSRAELTGLLGTIHPLNPLAMMCSLGLANSNGSSVTFVAVADDTLDSYKKALDVIGTNLNAWGVVPYSEDSTIHAAVVTAVKEYCTPEVMCWKTAWLAYDTNDIETVMDSLNGTVDGASTNKLTVTPSTTDITGIKAGDVITYNGGKYSVTSVFTAVAAPYILVSGVLPVGTISGATVTRPISATDKAEDVASYAAAFNSELVRVHYGDGPVLTEFPGEKCPMSYVAAAWAGKRSGVAPHQSLTRSTIDGIYFTGKSGFSTSVLNEMAGSGVWLTVTDPVDGTTYCRHQLTTKNQSENYNLKEDSKISNAHEICMTISAGYAEYYGRANVVDAALEVIRLRGVTLVDGIRSRNWSDLLGPQITAAESITVTKDPSFSDRVDVYMALATPDPLNNLDVYLTIS